MDVLEIIISAQTPFSVERHGRSKVREKRMQITAELFRKDDRFEIQPRSSKLAVG